MVGPSEPAAVSLFAEPASSLRCRVPKSLSAGWPAAGYVLDAEATLALSICYTNR